ncbi:hypothetical protein DYB25_004279 [Aphanomyces astaci]|uniref:Uncharacterized protein n=1 Tax=Aphanomyces astaci TaxID=112090 RepID=A0A397B3T7_APHAT|nr:hypothetical protein DYB25_004279 [Aphanomyces astaci]
MFTLREMSASSSVESVPHAEPLPSVEYVLHGKPLSSVESLSSVELLSSVGSVPYGEPLPLTFDALALGRATRPKRRVYKKHYRGLCYFFGLIWDYTSLLICAMTIPTGEHPKVPAGSQPADGVELWTMMIFHIRLSFRADEGIDVMCSQFLPPLTSVDEFGTVTMLDVQISGKTGKKKWIVLSLYRDDQCPELCPVRAVLAWIHLSRHPGTGYLFPHDKDATKCYPPATFQTKCRNVCTKVTGR